jgi:hypothetical protein
MKTAMCMSRVPRHRWSSVPGLVLAAALVAVAPAGCGGYGKTSTAPTAGTARARVCSLLTQAQADTAAGESVRGGQQQSGHDGPACYWHAANHNHPNTWVRVELIYKNTYDIGKLAGPITAASGIGDEAYLDKDDALYLHTGPTYVYVEVVTPNGTNNTAAERRAATQVVALL